MGRNGAARRRAGVREAGVDAASAPVVSHVASFEDGWRLPGRAECNAGARFGPESTSEGEPGMEPRRAQCRDGCSSSGGGMGGGGKRGRVATTNSRPSPSVGVRIPAHSEAGQTVAVRNFTAYSRASASFDKIICSHGHVVWPSGRASLPGRFPFQQCPPPPRPHPPPLSSPFNHV